MFILQNIKDFMDNPMGKGSTAIVSRQLIKDDLTKRFRDLTGRKKISLKTYKHKDDFYFHFIIPSESTERNNTYDVVLHFMADNDNKNDSGIHGYMVRFFSNSPGFTYTYAYAFNLNGLFIEELTDKFDDIIFENPPVTRNPGEIINYEKTTYFACLHLFENTRFFNKLHLNSFSVKYNEKDFKQKIRNTQRIKVEIDTENARIAREKKKAKKPESTKPRGGKEKKEKISGLQYNTPDPTKLMNRGKIAPKGMTKPKIRPK